MKNFWKGIYNHIFWGWNKLLKVDYVVYHFEQRGLEPEQNVPVTLSRSILLCKKSQNVPFWFNNNQYFKQKQLYNRSFLSLESRDQEPMNSTSEQKTVRMHDGTQTTSLNEILKAEQSVFGWSIKTPSVNDRSQTHFLTTNYLFKSSPRHLC